MAPSEPLGRSASGNGRKSDAETISASDRGGEDTTEVRVESLHGWLRRQAAVVGTAAVVGVLVGALVMAALTGWTGDARASEATGFALGALGLGFGVVGWSGSVLAGRSVVTMQQYLDTGSEWTERDSRRAMARIAGFGAGVMVGVSLLATML